MHNFENKMNQGQGFLARHMYVYIKKIYIHIYIYIYVRLQVQSLKLPTSENLIPRMTHNPARHIPSSRLSKKGGGKSAAATQISSWMRLFSIQKDEKLTKHMSIKDAFLWLLAPRSMPCANHSPTLGNTFVQYCLSYRRFPMTDGMFGHR